MSVPAPLTPWLDSALPKQKSSNRSTRPSLLADERALMVVEFFRGRLFTGRTAKGSVAKFATSKNPFILVEDSGVELKQVGGQQLTQEDLDVYEVLFKQSLTQVAAAEAGLPPVVTLTFSSRQLLRAVGLSIGGRASELLRERMLRLRDTNLRLTWHKDHGTEFWSGSLLSGIHIRTEHGGEAMYQVQFNLDMARLFQYRYGTYDLKIRRALRDNKLAQWLFTFFESHTGSVDYSLANLQERAGLDEKRESRVRQKFEAAIVRLNEETGWRCALVKSTRQWLMTIDKPNDTARHFATARDEAEQAGKTLTRAEEVLAAKRVKKRENVTRFITKA